MDTRPQSTSAFSRFSDLLRDTRRRKSLAATNNAPPHERHDSAHSYNGLPSRDDRKSNSQMYADRIRQMFSSTSAPAALTLNSLPTEILQQILLNLDLFELLRVRRVCALWNDLIPGDSPLLQEKMYLRPSRSLQIYSCVPALFDFDFLIHSAAAPPYTHFRLGGKTAALVRTCEEIVFHPLVKELHAYANREEFRRVAKGKEVEGEKEKREVASWQKMLVSMPPVHELRLRKEKGAGFTVLKTSTGEEGITLGDLFGALNGLAKS